MIRSEPRVVVVTDRTRCDDLAGRVAAILRAVPRGSVAIQIREKDLDGGPLLRLARELLAVATPAGADVWINDRVDLALIAGSHGAHLPEAGIAVADARRLARGFAGFSIGASRHDDAAALAAAADGADVVQLGPIFATPGKHAVGTGLLGVRARLPATTRLVAVGGIATPEHARAARSAGADAIAVVRAAWAGDDPAGTIRALVDAMTSTLR